MFKLVFWAYLSLAASHDIAQRDLGLVNTNIFPTVNNHLRNEWDFNGCYDDSVQNRTLSAAYFDSASMDGESCVTFCDQQGYNVAGTEYSSQCFCGIATPGFLKPIEDCNMPCNGDSGQACGGPDRLSVYVSKGEAPVTNTGDGVLVQYEGCWADSVGSRVLPVGVSVPGGTDAMTVAICTATCRGNSFDYAGVEYAGECYCGSSAAFDPIPNLSLSGTPLETGCYMLCKGNFSEFCGGSDRINVYSLPPIVNSSVSSSPSTSTTSAPVTSSDSPTVSLSDAPTTTSLVVPATTTPSSHDIIVNGGFEDVKPLIDQNITDDYSNSLAYNWTVSPLTSGNLVGVAGADTNLAHSGARAFIIVPSSDLETSNTTRSICVAQTAYHPSAGVYTVFMYIGRGETQAPESTSSTNSLRYEVLVDGGQIAEGSVCVPSEGECDVLNVKGEEAFNMYVWDIDLPAVAVGLHTLSVCGIYAGTDSGESDIFVVDDVSIIAP